MTKIKVPRLATVVLVAMVFAAVVWRLGPRRMLHDFERAHWGFVAAAAAINLMNTGVEAARWQWLAKSAIPAARLRSTFTGLIAGTLGNVILPFKLGDGLRAVVFAEAEAIPFAESLSTVILDRILDVSAFAVFATITVLVAPMPASAERVVRSVIAIALLGFGLLFWLARRVPRRAVASSAARGRLRIHVDQFLLGLAAFRQSRYLVPAAGLAMLSWVLRVLLVWTAFRAFDLQLPIEAAAVMLTVLNLGIAVAETPGNAGSFELSSITALAIYAVPADVALSFATVLHVAETLPIIALGLVMVWTGRLQIWPTVPNRPRGL